MCPSQATASDQPDEGASLGHPQHQLEQQLPRPEGDRVISWAELRRHGSDSDAWWVAINGDAYEVKQWAQSHPGGDLVLQHNAGRDASDAFAAFHRPGNARVLAFMAPFRVGRMENRYPPGQPSEATSEFRRLREKMEAAGMHQPMLAPYVAIAAWLVVIIVAAFWLAAHGYVVAAAVATALFWQQVAFVGHDAGHHAVTGQRGADDALGILVNAGVGIGISWWNNTHNTHHTVVNSADCDPDIQFMPLVANSELFFSSLDSKYHMHELTFDESARRLISVQHITFLPLLCIARYGLYIQAFKHIFTGRIYIHKWAELAGQVAFFAWYAALVATVPGGVLPRVGFVVLSHACFMILHLQICLSHFSCGVFDGLPPEGEWLRTQLAGTMNWDCPAWLDWFHGGLQFQIEHHLFPRMPRHRLREVSHLVRPLCARLGVRYHSVGFFKAIVELLATLKVTAMKARRLGPLKAPRRGGVALATAVPS